MTEKEIMKALKECEECHFFNDCEKSTRLALDLINRKNEQLAEKDAEIERLHKAIQVQEFMLENQDYKIKKARAEAIKEFAERVNREIIEAIISNDKAIAEREKKHKVNRYEDNFCAMFDGKVIALSGIKSFIDQIAKEMGVEL